MYMYNIKRKLPEGILAPRIKTQQKQIHTMGKTVWQRIWIYREQMHIQLEVENVFSSIALLYFQFDGVQVSLL